MGKYFDVTTIREKGQPTRITIPDKQPNIPFGKTLVAVMGNGLRDIAVKVNDPTEFNEFYQQYYSGLWLTFDLYLIDEEELA